MKLYYELEKGDELEEGDEFRHINEGGNWIPVSVFGHHMRQMNVITTHDISVREYRRPVFAAEDITIMQTLELELPGRKRKITIA